MQTRDQQFASIIYEQVMKLRETKDKTSYGSMAHTLPILIHTSGLAQALAFVDSRKKKDKGPGQFLEDLSLTVSGKSAEEFLQHVRTSELREYIYLTERTLAALLWYKRYGQAILGIEQGQEAENTNQGGDNGGEHAK